MRYRGGIRRLGHGSKAVEFSLALLPRLSRHKLQTPKQSMPYSRCGQLVSEFSHAAVSEFELALRGGNRLGPVRDDEAGQTKSLDRGRHLPFSDQVEM